MAGVRGERTNWTPYIIYFLAAVQAALGTYLNGRSEDQKAITSLESRVATMETEIPLRRQMRDQQIQDLALRVQQLERRR